MQHHKVSDQPGILHFDHFRLEGRPVERKDKLSSNEAHFQDIAAIDIINALLYYNIQSDADMEANELKKIPQHYAVQVKGTMSESLELWVLIVSIVFRMYSSATTFFIFFIG